MVAPDGGDFAHPTREWSCLPGKGKAKDPNPIQRTHDMRNGMIFDMDGVLFDSGPFHYESWRLLAREEGIEGIDQEWFRHSFGRTSAEIIHDLFDGEISKEEIRRMDERKEALYREVAHGHIRPMPGLRPLIDDLVARGWAIGVGSSGPRENVDLIIRELGIEKIVAASVSANDVKKGKPDPEIFLKTAGKLGVPPERCVVAEDAAVGVSAARAAGMHCVAITTTHPRHTLRNADRVVDSFEELTASDVERMLDGSETGSQ